MHVLLHRAAVSIFSARDGYVQTIENKATFRFPVTFAAAASNYPGLRKIYSHSRSKEYFLLAIPEVLWLN